MGRVSCGNEKCQGRDGGEKGNSRSNDRRHYYCGHAKGQFPLSIMKRTMCWTIQVPLLRFYDTEHGIYHHLGAAGRYCSDAGWRHS